MSEIKWPPIGEALKRRFQSDPQLTLGEQLVPTVVMELDRPEYQFPQGNILGIADHSITAVGASHLAIGLYNPDPNTLVLVESVWGTFWAQDFPNQTNLGPAIILRSTLANLPNLHLQENMRDTRWNSQTGASKNTTAQLRSAANPGVAQPGTKIGRAMGQTMSIATGANNDSKVDWWVPLPRPFVIAPTTAIAFYTPQSIAGITVILSVCICWTERPMSSWERQAIPTG